MGSAMNRNNTTLHAAEFKEILGIIHSGRSRAFEAVNVALIETYWANSSHARLLMQAGVKVWSPSSLLG
jgi:hypothetical protein